MKLMSRNKYNKLSILCILLIFSSCATYEAQYEKSVSNWYENNPDNDSEIDHTFYFIGDGGQANFDLIESNFSILKDELSKSKKNTTVLFLGDNIYEHGMPKKNHLRLRKQGHHRRHLDPRKNPRRLRRVCG